jgi:polysaccharide export outer membrane protein
MASFSFHRLLSWWLAGALLVAGLAVPRAHGQTDTPPPPDSRRATAYRVITNDRLGVHIFQEEDLSLTVRVDAKGNVNLNLVGFVHIYGQTLSEAERTIEKAYRDARILRHPEVTLTVEEPAPREVSVQGQVKNPNRYSLPMEAATTLSEIISRAGGFTDTAKGSAVRVTRILPDGSTHFFEVDVDGVMKGREKNKTKVEAANMVLEPGDLIYVPERII